MAEDVITLPVLKLEIPKPKTWDFVALAVLLVGLVVAAVNVTTAGLNEPGTSPSGSLTLVFVMVQLAVCCGSLLVLGKTAKEGTIHGNLFAVGGMMLGLGGIMLAAALWAAT